MSPETCAVLANLFPLVLIAVLADRRLIHNKLRATKWYRSMFVTTVTACVIGLVYAVIGVQFGGYTPEKSVVLWAIFGVAIFALTMSVLMNGASAEIEEDRVAKQDDVDRSKAGV